MGDLIKKLRQIYASARTEVLPLLEDVLGETVQSFVTDTETSTVVKGGYDSNEVIANRN